MKSGHKTELKKILLAVASVGRLLCISRLPIYQVYQFTLLRFYCVIKDRNRTLFTSRYNKIIHTTDFVLHYSVVIGCQIKAYKTLYF